MNHEMDLIRTSDKGVELWKCPICGRVIGIIWEPFQKYVLVDGDETVGHIGAKGGIRIGNVAVAVTEDMSNPDGFDQELWEKLLRGI